MRIFEQEFEKGGNKKKRILFSIGFEEVELLHAILTKAANLYPEITAEDQSRVSRIKNMRRGLSVYLGRAQPAKSREAGNPCPICHRKLFGDEGVAKHLKDVHPNGV